MIDLTQIKGALAAVLMASTHSLFQFPAGVVNIIFYRALADREKYGVFIPKLWAAYLMSFSGSSVGSLVDFFIYLFIFGAFRTQLFRILKCPASARQQPARPELILRIPRQTLTIMHTPNQQSNS